MESLIEVTGNLWTYPAAIRLITTNGTINAKGQAVMGRGCARESTERYPRIQTELADRIRESGNRPHAFPDYGLITFPVKHNWWEVANIQL
ncbi:MAG: ADP-ribose-binding protein, partial [Actinobacteria bacterium]|nr:ADP-ribose-binding protein [Actinomycetota bacterium]